MLKLLAPAVSQKIQCLYKHRLPINHGILASAFSTLTGTKRVGTHNGSFHCDEALACFLLRLTKDFSAAEIVRTRDPQVLDSLDAVVDVGGVYDPVRHRFDHHQKGFEEVLGHGFSTKLSSAGLVYKHYGLEIIAKELKLDEGHPQVHQLYRAVYKNFMEAIDAVDNGVSQYDPNQPPRYVINTSLSSRIKRLNLDWIDLDQSPERENEAFHQAMSLVGCEFLENVHYYAKSWLPARSIVMESLAARETIDSCGEIIKLSQSCPWKLHIHELEEEMKIDPSIKYVIYPSFPLSIPCHPVQGCLVMLYYLQEFNFPNHQDDRSENWRLQAVAISPHRFESRKPLLHPWRGLENDELSEVAGIPGCIFVHMSGFIGGNRTYDGAVAMARASLKA